MEIERAIEILNPEHREHYDSIEEVNEARRMGMEALERQIPKKPELENFRGLYPYFACPECGWNLRSENYCCSMCGQEIDWSEFLI